MPDSQLAALDATGAIPIPGRWRHLFDGEVIATALPHGAVGLYPPHAFAQASEAARVFARHDQGVPTRARELFGSAIYLQALSEERIELPEQHGGRLGGPGSRVLARRVGDHLVLRRHRDIGAAARQTLKRYPWLALLPLLPLLIPAVALGLSSLAGRSPRTHPHFAGRTTATAPRARAISPIGCVPGPGEQCGPIHYTLNPTGSADPTFEGDVYTAISRISRTSGVRFVFDGVTTEVPTLDRAAYQPGRYGNRWAPLLIAWTSSPYIVPAGSAFPSGGRPTCRLHEQRSMYISGQVALRNDAILPGRFSSRAAWGTIIMREVVRALGIPYSNNAADLLYMGLDSLQQATWGPGDRAALGHLRANDRCTP